MKLSTLTGALLLLLCACSGPQGKAMHSLAPEINGHRYTGQDQIAPGDKLAIKFAFAKDWDQEVTVRSDGKAAFLDLDELTVAGMLPSQLDERLTAAYTEVLSGTTTNLTVDIVEQAPRFAYVVGQVGTSGPIELPKDQELTFLQAITMAGNYDTYTAWLGNTHFVRWDPESQTQRTWVVDARIRHWGEPETILLQPNDLIYIPNTRVDRVGIQLQMWIARMIPFPRGILY